VIGRVVEGGIADGDDPLLFFGGKYRSIAALDER